MDGTPIGNAKDVMLVLRAHQAGETVVVEVSRDERNGILPIQLARRSSCFFKTLRIEAKKETTTPLLPILILSRLDCSDTIPVDGLPESGLVSQISLENRATLKFTHHLTQGERTCNSTAKWFSQ